MIEQSTMQVEFFNKDKNIASKEIVTMHMHENCIRITSYDDNII